MATILVDISLYEALITAANAGDLDKVSDLDRRIRKASDASLYRLWVRWLETGGKPAPSISPFEWPKSQTAEIVLDRAIEKADVESMIQNRSIAPVDIHVTRDPDGLVGWHTFESFEYGP